MARARATGRDAWASVSRPAVVRDAGLARIASEVRDDTVVYWRAPAGAEAIVAIGAAAEVRASGSERMSVATAAVAECLADVIHDGSDAAGWSPRCFGGFAFFDDEADAGWPGWGSAVFRLPGQVAGRIGDAGFVGACVRVQASDDPERIAESLAARLSIDGTTPWTPRPPGIATPPPSGDDAWVTRVRDAVDEIRRGSFAKVVPVRAADVTLARRPAPGDLVLPLVDDFPDCWVYAFGEGAGGLFVGATPERLLRVDGTHARTMALAGSARRPTDAAADVDARRALLDSSKDREEHRLVVDMVVDTLGAALDAPPSVDGPEILALRNILHLKTRIGGTLRADADIGALLARLHPTPAVGGTPREPALSFIRRTEGHARGWFAGAVGWMTGPRALELVVALRSARILDRRATLFAGAGIVAASDPESELRETTTKMGAMRRILEGTP